MLNRNNILPQTQIKREYPNHDSLETRVKLLKEIHLDFKKVQASWQRIQDKGEAFGADAISFLGVEKEIKEAYEVTGNCLKAAIEKFKDSDLQYALKQGLITELYYQEIATIKRQFERHQSRDISKNNQEIERGL